ncbi:hypothetical protein [Streptomyces sp. NPDC020742]|uniref:hypothetical protein n=1 Tax=unclassified Streptomyces TaxID=2593676 RepID=UPI0033F7F154
MKSSISRVPHLITSRGTGRSPTRYADAVEELQLGRGECLLERARALTGDPAADARQLRFLSVQLSAALRDAVRVAESRGVRAVGK